MKQQLDLRKQFYLTQEQIKKLEPYRNFLIAEGYNSIVVDVFLVYHMSNKSLWELYESKAFELIKLGAKRLSSKGIFEKLREDADLKKIGQFKAPNEFTPFYARIFVFKYPQCRGLFEFKNVGERMAA